MKITSIRPDILTIGDLYREHAFGLSIPSIQRQFVWNDDDIKELLDSIINGYPIGSIIIWEPDKSFPGVPLLGKSIPKNNEHKYVLDGQQRLTSLMLLLNNWSITRGSKTINSSTFTYVPENRKIYQGTSRGINLTTIVKASLADAESLAILQKSFSSNFTQIINEVGQKIVNYKIPIYSLKTISDEKDEADNSVAYEVIADIFTRVNAAGIKVGNLEMFLSFFAAHFPKEDKDKIIEMHEELSELYELDLEPLVRFVFSLTNLTQNQITKVKSFKKAIQSLAMYLNDNNLNFQEILVKARLAIKTSFEILNKKFGLDSTKLIPSQIVLIPIFSHVYHRGYESFSAIDTVEVDKISKWFLISSFNTIYSSSTNKKLEEDLSLLLEVNTLFPLKHLLKNMKDRQPRRNDIIESDIIDPRTNVLRGSSGKVYLMLLYIALINKKATDWAGRDISSNNFTYQHIFPREYMRTKSEYGEDMINCLGNITLISRSVNSEISDTSPDNYLVNYDSSVIKAHMIPESQSLWKIEKYEEFIEKRLNLIWKEIKKLI